MTRRRKFRKKYSKQVSRSSTSSFSNKQRLLARRQRRRMRQRFRRKQQRRMKGLTRSISITSQLATDVLDMLHISTEVNTKPLEFIERYELTREQAFKMPVDLRPIIFLLQSENHRICSTRTRDFHNDINDDYYSSYV